MCQEQTPAEAALTDPRRVRARDAKLQPPRHPSSAWFMQRRSEGGRSCSGAGAWLGAVLHRLGPETPPVTACWGSECRAPTGDAGGTGAGSRRALFNSEQGGRRAETQPWPSFASAQLPSPAAALPPLLTSVPFPPPLPSPRITTPPAPAQAADPAPYAERRRGPALTALLSPSSVRWSWILPAAGDPCSSCSRQAVLGSEELFWCDRCAPGRRPSLPPAGPSAPAAGSGRRPGGGPLP